MKIFILNPNFNTERKSIINIRNRQPLSLATIASILRNRKHEVTFLDANVLGLSCGKIIEDIKNSQSEVLILTSTPIDRWECPNANIDNIFKIIDSAQVKYKILTGSHGTTSPEWIVSKCSVDFIIKGEPELIVAELVENIDNQNNNKIITAERITDLDSLPMPAYDLLPMDKYSASGFKQPFSIMMTSRGCPYSCTYCLKAMLPEKYIVQSPIRVVQEIEHLINNFNVESIYFQDWEFLINPNRVEEICDLVLEKKLYFKWGCNARATDIAKNKELVKLMQKAGCDKVNLGLESASDKILEKINKKITKQDLQNAIDILKEGGIESGYYVLLNCPGETKATIRETVDFILANNLKVKNFNPVIPYPGTRLFQGLNDKNINWDNVENYAGKVDTSISPIFASWYLRHYKFKKQYGKLYFLKLKFWKKYV